VSVVKENVNEEPVNDWEAVEFAGVRFPEALPERVIVKGEAEQSVANSPEINRQLNLI